MMAHARWQDVHTRWPMSKLKSFFHCYRTKVTDVAYSNLFRAIRICKNTDYPKYPQNSDYPQTPGKTPGFGFSITKPGGFRYAAKVKQNYDAIREQQFTTVYSVL